MDVGVAIDFKPGYWRGVVVGFEPLTKDPDMNIIDMIKAVQTELGLEVDGKPGIQTWGAIFARICPEQAAKPITEDLVDERSEKNIATLQPHVRPYARALVQKAADMGITVKIISGTRSKAEQDALYAKGRTAPGKIVTNARFGYSNHNFGLAFDIGIFQGSKYLENSPLYKAVMAIARPLGLECGGDWKSIVDEPHFQLRPSWAKGMTESQMLTALRNGRSAVG